VSKSFTARGEKNQQKTINKREEGRENETERAEIDIQSEIQEDPTSGAEANTLSSPLPTPYHTGI
jgi:hypothetical protein